MNLEPIKWKSIVRIELNAVDREPKMSQSALVYLAEDGRYFAALTDGVWEHIGITPATDIKDGLNKAYELAETWLARRVAEDEAEAARRRELKVVERKGGK